MRKDFWLFLLFCSIVFGIVLVLSSGALLPWSYFAFSLLASVILILMLHKSGSKSWFLYASLIVLSLLLPNLYNIASGFRVIPLFDSYCDYAAIRIFMEEGRVYQLENIRGASIGIANISNWPLSAIFTMILSLTAGIEVLHLSLLMPSIYGIVMILFMMLFLKILMRDSPNSSKALIMALLIFVVSPDAVYQRMVFYHRFFGLSIFFMALYLVEKMFCFQHKSKVTYILLLLLSVTIALSHSVVSYTYTQFLLYFVVFAIFRKVFFEKWHNPSSIVAPSLTLPLISLIIVTMWNSHVAQISFPWIGSFILRLLSPMAEPVAAQLVNPEYIPEALASPIIVQVLRARDLAMYLPALAGLSIFLISFVSKRDVNVKKIFLLYYSVAMAIMLIIIYVTAGDPLHFAVMYASPIIVYFASLFYTPMSYKKHPNKRKVVSILVSLVLIFVTFVAFLSPWSHTYFARFLYDPSIKPEDVGMHNPSYSYMIPFVENYFKLNGKKVLSDAHTHPLYVVLQPKDYKSIDERLDFLGKSDTYVFELINLNPRFKNGLKIPGEVVEFEYNKVLDARCYAIHYKGT